MKEFFANLTNASLTTAQMVLLCIAALGAAVLLFVFFYFLYLMIFKPDLKAEIHAMEALFRTEKKHIIAERKQAEAEIKKSEKALDAQTERLQRMTDELRLMEDELMRQGIKEDEAREIAGMTLEELFRLRNEERQDVSSDFVINAITRKVLIDSRFDKRPDVLDFKVPLNKTTVIDPMVIGRRLDAFADAEAAKNEAKGESRHKINGKSFALFSVKKGGSVKLTLKCGPYYAQRLVNLYPDFFIKAKFPAGMIWFCLENKGDCSLELMELLLDISYNIAKAGY